MEGGRRHVLVTGLLGVGKTTLIQRVAQELSGYHPAGFYTEELRVEGIRKGFRLMSLDGRQQILSHVGHRSPHRVGRYGVDVAGFERLLRELDLCHAASAFVVVDEIGRMECLSQGFRKEVTMLLDSSKNVLATIALKGNGFIQSIKRRPDCRLVTVTVENRDYLVKAIVKEMIKATKETQ